METIHIAEEENEAGVKWTTDARLLQLHVIHICAIFLITHSSVVAAFIIPLQIHAVHHGFTA